MKKLTIIICLAFVSLINFSAKASMFEDGIDKAKKLIAIERYEAAHHLIESEIVKDPENPENFYRAGILYLSMGWDTQADRCFNDATIVSKGSKYKVKVAKVFQARAFIKVNNGDIHSASLLFTNAHALVDTKDEDTVSLLRYGKEYLERGQEDRAYPNFKVAQNINPQLGGVISDIYYNVCEHIRAPCLSYYRRAKEFSRKNNPQIAQLLFSLYNTKGISAQHKKTLKKEIKLYVSKAEYKIIFPPPPPDYKIYPPGTYTIRLKAGETTNHWIMFPRGRKNNYSVMSKDNKFILILSNGQEYKGWGNINPPHMTRSKFKLKAINDQIITLKVT